MLPKLYLYGIVNSPNIINISSPGVTNSKPYIIPFEDIGIIVSTYAGKNIDMSLDDLSKHDNVINELMQDYCVLPIRFKTIVESEADIINTYILQKYTLVKSNFEKLINKYEMGLKVIWHIDKVKQDININKKQKDCSFTPDTPAKIFMQQKMNDYNYQDELRKRAEIVKETIVGELIKVCCAFKIKLLESERMVVNGAFLIDRTSKDQFVLTVEKLQSAQNSSSFLLSGPWAPYNFVEFDPQL